ncbi:hypothetical protein AB6A40_002939 [Gnathostoma spinigerum]|uniref:SAM domain-containing protein n=1 Tax=Gnathostoma spinigerum TaxID=75299 RepID=A0ABD6EIV8_9BILA
MIVPKRRPHRSATLNLWIPCMIEGRAQYLLMNDVDQTAEQAVASSTSTSHHSDQIIEEKIQIDRKRLESMITGHPLYGSDKHLPSAEEFFQKVTELSGARISWPSRLKIGAKTKKDPFVKVYGTSEQVGCARQLIASVLQIKRDRVTLKIEIHHADHSKIIGRKGRNTQDIMRETMCHIHFPDSNKNEDLEKNNQVTISGSAEQVEKARVWLRNLSPLLISVNLPNSGHLELQDVQRYVATAEVNVTLRDNPDGSVNCVLKSTPMHDILVVKTVLKLAEIFGVQSELQTICSTTVHMRSSLLSLIIGDEKCEQMLWLAKQTSTTLHCTPPSPDRASIHIVGPITGVLIARKYIISLMPVSMHFDRVVESENDTTDKYAIESKYGIAVNEKWRRNQSSNNVSLVVLSGIEANISHLYQARDRILHVVKSSFEQINDPFAELKTGSLHKLKNDMRSEAQGRRAVERSICATTGVPDMPSTSSTKESRSQSASDETQNPSDSLIDSSRFETDTFSQVTPDPDQSPIAHSLLTGIKHIDQRRSEQERAQSREKMLLRANRAVYDSTPTHVRHPTDVWSGYGFSNSLPADILKSGFHLFDNLQHSQTDVRPVLSQDSRQNESPVREVSNSVTPSLGLASVLEEDEHSDTLDSSNSNSLLSSSSFQNLQQLFPPPAKPPISRCSRRDFSASTGIFDTIPIVGNDLVWDIRVFIDPAMVLAQLGCGEYLAQFRDQEIDMEAFLLLDEQNLKDIGVSTMGARKKLYNAILKLRESAEMYGMRL